MTAPSKILRNVGSSSLGYAVNVIVGLKLGPYVTDKLGDTAFGIWTLVVCFVGYYGLFDVGIRSAVGHYVATYHARRDAAGVNRTLSTAMALLLVVALFAAAVTVAAGRFLPTPRSTKIFDKMHRKCKPVFHVSSSFAYSVHNWQK